MDSQKIFQERNIVTICSHILNYCETHINTTSTLSDHYVRSFHTFLPTLLVYIFGSPSARGWLQTETDKEQDDAIRNLLLVNGHFFQALVKLSMYPEYSYDLVTESLPSDVRHVLATGAIHLLPRVYKSCSYLDASKTTSSVNIRTTATRQSTLVATTLGGDRKIRFNMLQFYLYYFASVPTWPPLVPPPLQPSAMSFIRGSSATANTTQNSNAMLHTKAVEYGTIRSTSANTTANGATTASANSPSTPYQIPGKLRSIIPSVYGSVFEEYFNRFVPINTSQDFPHIIDTFFLDTCIELWIRTSWVAFGQKLSMEYMHSISSFVSNIVKHNLQQCFADQESLYYAVYTSVKDELFFMLSRLTHNWSKNDDYLQVMELWSMWAAPWRMGAIPRTSEKEVYTPIKQGWALFVLDNIPFYFSIVNIILQRTSTFEYKDSIQPATTTLSSFTDTGTIRGQLRILYRLINVLKAEGLVEFLGLIEKGLESVQSNAISILAANANNPFKQISLICYGSDTLDMRVQEKLGSMYKLFVELEEGNTWKPQGLYSTEPRSENLLKTLNLIHNAYLARSSTQNAAKAAQLKDAYDFLASTFKVTGTSHLLAPNNNTTTAATPTNTQQSTVKHRRYEPRVVGLGEGGFLTMEEKILLRDGKAVCSRDNIFAMGPRAKTYVRSYEDPTLVRWSLQLDTDLNKFTKVSSSRVDYETLGS
ncbi:hypothetical protein HMPREF1544_01641 [Mucor circinelloides 1006PhL]|uniref:Uncharacterized protein n=1 Tax=Mucor circinelloides f. circinelloides (strain 1006PhL) TaxID=1220926 RepID=S2KGI7_MUCC1|nr:hypothetical protein HMPREF1544_01641 [Mucor circinelloides 1006PhL]